MLFRGNWLNNVQIKMIKAIEKTITWMFDLVYWLFIYPSHLCYCLNMIKSLLPFSSRLAGGIISPPRPPLLSAPSSCRCYLFCIVVVVVVSFHHHDHHCHHCCRHWNWNCSCATGQEHNDCTSSPRYLVLLFNICIHIHICIYINVYAHIHIICIHIHGSSNIAGRIRSISSIRSIIHSHLCIFIFICICIRCDVSIATLMFVFVFVFLLVFVIIIVIILVIIVHL